MAHYKWQLDMSAAGPIWAGVTSGDTSEHSTDVLTGSTEGSYGYLDSNVVSSAAPPGTNNTSRVVLTVDTSWSVSFDSHNYMTVTVSTIMVGIERDMVVGNPAGQYGFGRDLRAYHYSGGAELWHYFDSNINQAKQIAADVNLGSFTFTLAPGESASQYSMYFFNKTRGTQSAGDHLYLGVRFTNDMPADYRPGAILSTGQWLSHNRAVGEAHILNGTWQEMRTIQGHTENTNPPSIRMSNIWTNQKLIGKE